MPMGQQDNELQRCLARWRRAPDARRLPAVTQFAGPTAPRAPYSLEPTVFPFPALAALVGRAALGGQREVALACLVVGRLVLDATSSDALTADQRQTRGQRTRHWLGSAALPQPVRAALVRLVDAAAVDDPTGMAGPLDAVMTVTANLLDPAARLELDRLAQAVAGQRNSGLLSR